jgi:hypothetical protein
MSDITPFAQRRSELHHAVPALTDAELRAIDRVLYTESGFQLIDDAHYADCDHPRIVIEILAQRMGTTPAGEFIKKVRLAAENDRRKLASERASRRNMQQQQPFQPAQKKYRDVLPTPAVAPAPIPPVVPPSVLLSASRQLTNLEGERDGIAKVLNASGSPAAWDKVAEAVITQIDHESQRSCSRRS